VEATGPTLLLVRDVQLTDDSAAKMEKAKTDLPFAELKTEVAIDRVTSAATPRTIERVPAGAEFGPAELVFSLYSAADYDRLKVVIDALQLVEDDYVGGSGSRGSGKVEFTGIEVFARARGDYSAKCNFKTFAHVSDLAAAFADLKTWMQTTIPVK
jgi:CRISPR-associated protein Csm3